MFTAGKIHFWLFPNLNDDNYGFFESFKPLYSVKGLKRKKKKKKDNAPKGEDRDDQQQGGTQQAEVRDEQEEEEEEEEEEEAEEGDLEPEKWAEEWQ